MNSPPKRADAASSEIPVGRGRPAGRGVLLLGAGGIGGGRTGTGRDIAAAAVFRASDEANDITGVRPPVDGGLTCKAA